MKGNERAEIISLTDRYFYKIHGAPGWLNACSMRLLVLGHEFKPHVEHGANLKIIHYFGFRYSKVTKIKMKMGCRGASVG